VVLPSPAAVQHVKKIFPGRKNSTFLNFFLSSFHKSSYFITDFDASLLL
jgi:hypothetical protein